MNDFRSWIKKFEGIENPFGDLADAIKIDKNFPNENSYIIIKEYLKNTFGEIIFEEAWKSYEKNNLHKKESSL